MKIIFLDIDGVLAVSKQEYDKYGALFHNNFVDNLKHIIDETDAKIVITSTWRFSGYLTILELWENRNLPGQVIGITPDLSEMHRGAEIESWIIQNEVKDYVIIDDDNDMYHDQLPYFVQTYGNTDHSDCVDLGYGLTKECAEQAIKILNSK